MSEQPEALRLANELEALQQRLPVNSAAELRRLHAQCERMREALQDIAEADSVFTAEGMRRMRWIARAALADPAP